MEVYTYDELLTETMDHLKTGVKLISTGITGMDKYYQVKSGSVTDITGYPYSGKTLLLNDILYNTAIAEKWKHLLHLPDSGKPAEVAAYLLSKRTGKLFDKRFLDRQIQEHEVIHELRWLDQHFKILKKGKERPTPIEYWKFANDLGVNTASIDSWNFMRHTGSGTDYLAQTLSERNELAEESGLHYFTIIHPRNPTSNDFDKNGNLKAPDTFNLMGGSEWNNNAKNVLVVHKESKESKNYDVYIRKVKPRAVGMTGINTLQFNNEEFKFYKEDPFVPVPNPDSYIESSSNKVDGDDLPF